MIDILLAEDNPGDVLLVREALADQHIVHRLHVCADGAQALEFLAQMGKVEGPPCPGLMLLDLNLPKVDGAQILLELRKHPECMDTPVIILSSSGSPREER